MNINYLLISFVSLHLRSCINLATSDFFIFLLMNSMRLCIEVMFCLYYAIVHLCMHKYSWTCIKNMCAWVCVMWAHAGGQTCQWYIHICSRAACSRRQWSKQAASQALICISSTKDPGREPLWGCAFIYWRFIEAQNQESGRPTFSLSLAHI